MNKTNEKKMCFIITPIGSESDQIRRHIDGIIDAVLMPLLKDEFDVYVAHRMCAAGSITKQVIEKIVESDLVIANLTENNPNVMYELAVRHSLGRPVIQIAQCGTTIPFDIGPERTIFYLNDSKGVIELSEKFQEFIKCIDYEDDRQGPIYEVLNSISYKEKVIKDIENDRDVNDQDSGSLGYIIKRLDELEDKLYRGRYYYSYKDEEDLLMAYSGIISERQYRIEIKRWLHQMGFPDRVTGTKYLEEAIWLASQQEGFSISAPMDIYPRVASTYNTKVSNVERGIRLVIERVWTSETMDRLKQYYPFEWDIKIGRPTNMNFIENVVRLIKNKFLK